MQGIGQCSPACLRYDTSQRHPYRIRPRQGRYAASDSIIPYSHWQRAYFIPRRYGVRRLNIKIPHRESCLVISPKCASIVQVETSPGYVGRSVTTCLVILQAFIIRTLNYARRWLSHGFHAINIDIIFGHALGGPY